jgi:hypothetical protein
MKISEPELPDDFVAEKRMSPKAESELSGGQHPFW